MFFLLLIPYPLWGQEKEQILPPLLTLDQAVKLALDHNRQIKNARLEVEKSSRQIEAFKRHFFPTIDFKLSESYLLTSSDYLFNRGIFGTYPGVGPIPAEDTRISSTKRWSTFLSTTLAQPLSQIYKIDLGIDSLKLGQSIALEKQRALSHSVRAEVKRHYYGIIQAQNALEALEELIKALKELERIMIDQTHRQMVLESDLLEAKARLAKAEYEALTLRNTLTVSRQHLNGLLGRDLAEEFRVMSIPEPVDFLIEMATVKARASDLRPEIKEARLKKRHAENEIRIKKAEYLPDFSLVFNYFSPFDSDILPRNVATIGLQLTWDVFDWGRRKQELAERIGTLEQARNDLKETEKAVTLDVQTRLNKLREAELLIKATRLAKEAGQEKFRTTLNRYKVQAALFQDVLNIQASLAEAIHNHQNAMISFWTAKADLEKAMGEEP
jgi:outer membrane protein TolC